MRITRRVIVESFDTIARSLGAFTECFKIGLEALGREAEDAIRLGKLNRLALEKRTLKQDAIGAIDGSLEALLGGELSAGLCRDLLVFRAEWETIGLGLARLHFRLNSVQLHNAIRPDIALSAAPGQSPSRRHFLAEVTRLLDGVSPVNVHYGTVAHEQTTAKRVFMLAAQFQKHFDGRVPIRLLIAESDTPFTLLAALYYAKLFGVERHVEISPLFETADGLASRRPRDQRAARQPAFRELHPLAGAVLHPARVLGLGPLHRAARRVARDRALQAAADPPLAAARLRRHAAAVLRHARRVDRPRRASAQPRGPVPVHALERGAQTPERARDAAQARGELPGRGRVSVVRVRAHGVRGRDRPAERAAHPAARDAAGRALLAQRLGPRLLPHAQGLPGAAREAPRLSRADQHARPQHAVSDRARAR